MDRACGVLLGQAAGDALGVPYEFATPPRAGQLAEMTGGGLGDYAPGEWSDDTQMAACIAQVGATGADLTGQAALDQIAENFLRWAAEGATDIGIQTSSVLRAARTGGAAPHVRLREAAAAYARRNPRSAGNGALMRTSIVGLSALDDRDRTARAARRVAELTHADPLAGDSAVLWSEAVRVAVAHRRLDLAGGLDLLPLERRDTWAKWITDAETSAPATFNPNGFTVSALQAAWAAITQTPVPEDAPERSLYPCGHLQDALHAAVRIGNDTDTVAAIAGGLLGAYWGQSAVPLSWVRRIHGWPGLRARDLVRLAALTARGGRSDDLGWPAVEHLTYGITPRAALPHPLDAGVYLGTENAEGHDATAVVSLFRRGTHDVPIDGVSPGDHLEVRLIDSSNRAANPNLAFTLADTADVVAELRAEGHRVLLHCVQAQQRTPSTAVAYAVRLGAAPEEARRMIAAALPPEPTTGQTLGLRRRRRRHQLEGNAMNGIVGWLNTTAFTSFGAPTTWAEVLGFLTGAGCVYLVARQHLLNWPLGIANNGLWILLFASAGLYADSGLQVVYILLGVWGWLQWLHGGTHGTTRVVSGTSRREWAGLCVAGVALTLGLTWFLAALTPSTVPLWDALTTTLSLLAVYGQAMKRWESWLLWMAADVIYVPLYHVKGLDLTALLYVGFFLLCVKGLRDWRRDLQARPAAAPVPALEMGSVA
ncbi:nicotinamide riboside transporter PnuC [Nocardioides panacis]|nr:nicotinamide riboside transporter PnuC [Nocardioides panacis]